MATIGRILTGHRPTGPRHIGHLVGTLESWAVLQDSYECFFLIADLHVLTTDYAHPDQIQNNILEMLADWLAAGIDPEHSRIVLQSAVHEHTQLAALLGMLVTIARLYRVPTFKEQVQELQLNPSLGLFSYPVLQSADILLYKANRVPVGGDQLPHIELSKEIARRFNKLYGEIFPIPEAILSDAPRLPGIDNRTMHTSYGNAILLKDSPELITQKVMSMYTDPTRIHASDPGHVEGNPVFEYFEIFNPDREEVDDLKDKYRQGRIGDVQVKKRLVEVLNVYLEPIRRRRREYLSRPDDMLDILRSGTEFVSPIARATLKEVEEKMGISLRLE